MDHGDSVGHARGLRGDKLMDTSHAEGHVRGIPGAHPRLAGPPARAARSQPIAPGRGMPASSVPNWPTSRSIVAASKRSVLYSKRPISPEGRSSSLSDRSNFDVPVVTSSVVSDQPDGSAGTSGSNVISTWKYGLGQSRARRVPAPATRMVPRWRSPRSSSRARGAALRGSGIAAEVGPQHQRVEEEAKQDLQLRGGRAPTTQCRWRGRSARQADGAAPSARRASPCRGSRPRAARASAAWQPVRTTLRTSAPRPGRTARQVAVGRPANRWHLAAWPTACASAPCGERARPPAPIPCCQCA